MCKKSFIIRPRHTGKDTFSQQTGGFRRRETDPGSSPIVLALIPEIPPELGGIFCPCRAHNRLGENVSNRGHVDPRHNRHSCCLPCTASGTLGPGIKQGRVSRQCKPGQPLRFDPRIRVQTTFSGAWGDWPLGRPQNLGREVRGVAVYSLSYSHRHSNISCCARALHCDQNDDPCTLVPFARLVGVLVIAILVLGGCVT